MAMNNAIHPGESNTVDGKKSGIQIGKTTRVKVNYNGLPGMMPREKPMDEKRSNSVSGGPISQNLLNINATSMGMRGQQQDGLTTFEHNSNSVSHLHSSTR